MSPIALRLGLCFVLACWGLMCLIDSAMACMQRDGQRGTIAWMGEPVVWAAMEEGIQNERILGRRLRLGNPDFWS